MFCNQLLRSRAKSYCKEQFGNKSILQPKTWMNCANQQELQVTAYFPRTDIKDSSEGVSYPISRKNQNQIKNSNICLIIWSKYKLILFSNQIIDLYLIFILNKQVLRYIFHFHFDHTGSEQLFKQHVMKVASLFTLLSPHLLTQQITVVRSVQQILIKKND